MYQGLNGEDVEFIVVTIRVSISSKGEFVEQEQMKKLSLM